MTIGEAVEVLIVRAVLLDVVGPATADVGSNGGLPPSFCLLANTVSRLAADICKELGREGIDRRHGLSVVVLTGLAAVLPTLLLGNVGVNGDVLHPN
jgi:hypothetical protein